MPAMSMMAVATLIKAYLGTHFEAKTLLLGGGCSHLALSRPFQYATYNSVVVSLGIIDSQLLSMPGSVHSFIDRKVIAGTSHHNHGLSIITAVLALTYNGFLFH